MGAHLIRGTRQRPLDPLQIQQVVVTTREASTPRPAVSTSMRGAASPYNPSRRRSTEAGGSTRMPRIAGNHRTGPQQLPAVIPIAWSRHPCRETDAYAPGAGPCGCAPLLLACALDSPVRTLDRARRWGAGNDSVCGSAALPGSSPRSVHIDDQPGISCPVEHPAGGGKRFAGQQILLKACSQCFHSTLIEGR
jgi:hypothetical protein